MDHAAPLILIVGIGFIAFVIFGMRKTTGDNSSARPAYSAHANSKNAGSRERTAADIRATKTSRVIDEVSILDELDKTTNVINLSG